MIVIDKDTAFTLFGDDDPVGRTVKMDETEYEVVGVAGHSRRIGETGESAAWVPLGTVTGCELMVLSTPASKTDTFSMFRTRAEESFGQGTAISLVKEKQITSTLKDKDGRMAAEAVDAVVRILRADAV